MRHAVRKLARPAPTAGFRAACLNPSPTNLSPVVHNTTDKSIELDSRLAHDAPPARMLSLDEALDLEQRAAHR